MSPDYPNLQGIHCFSTAPYWEGRGLCGDRRQPATDFEMPDYLLKTLVLSALQWKRLNGPITLFTDRCFFEFLKERSLLDCWTEVRVVFDDLRFLFPDLKQSVFWAACKIYSYQLMSAPFICVDTDLIIREPVRFDSDADLIVTHYELLDQNAYASKSELKLKEGCYVNATQDSYGLNMSLCYFRNEAFKKLFVEAAFNIMSNSFAEYDGRYALPELLYMEQVRPLELAREHGYKVDRLMNCMWSPQKGCFVENDERYGYWVFFELVDTQAPIMHLWFHKNWLEKNKEARIAYLNTLNHFIQETYPALAKRV